MVREFINGDDCSHPDACLAETHICRICRIAARDAYDAERAEHAKQVTDLKAALRAIATADTADWCRPEAGLQGMANEALSKTKDKKEGKT